LKKLILVASIFAILALAIPCPSRPEDKPAKPRWTADFRAETGMDSLERRYYRPTFRFSFPVFGAPSWRGSAGLMYDQRLNGRLRGASDFWLTTGLERELPGNWSLEAAVRHMCRHETSRDNPAIFDVNEVLGILRLRAKNFTLGLGFGGYIGKTRDYRRLAMISMTLPDVPAEGISLETEVKWIDFSQWLYEAGFSVAIGPNTALFLRGARTYRFPAAVYIGFRYTSGETGGRPSLENFKFAAGAVPFDERFKLAASGEYRLELHRKGRSRLITDVGFSSPVLYGDGFFSQFRPDKLVYNITGEYEREVSPFLFVSWYAAYAVDMPADKALSFAGSLGTGLKLKNQPNFERLDRSFRFALAAGWNFKYDEELTLRAGVNTVPEKGLIIGADLECRMSGRRRAEIDMRLFTNIGRAVAVRPFIGLRNGPSLSRTGPSGKFKFVVGICLLKQRGVRS
jgi:hypothetical protein